MDCIRRLSIRHRLLGVLMLSLAMLLALGLTGVHGTRTSVARATAFIDREFLLASTLGDLREAIASLRVREKDMLISLHDRSAVEQHKQGWDAAAGAVDRGLDSLKEALANERDSAAAVEAVRHALNTYRQQFMSVHRLIAGGAIDTADSAAKAMVRAGSSFDEATVSLVELSERLKSTAVAAREDLHRTGVRLVWVVGIALLVAVAMTAPITLLNSRAIVAPLQEAVGLADRIATGDLSATASPQGQDELSALHQALARMTDGLRQTVLAVAASSSALHDVAREIAAGSEDLAQRTTRQSESLQAAAGSTVTIDEAVRDCAALAKRADAMGGDTARVVAAGRERVEQVVATMQDLRASSSRMADIVGLIDALAYQTNLLALNAAVEAARAGRQGRGFAVVAGEVRTLAQRSADAARQIATLIESSVAQVRSGVELVQHTGQAMNEIDTRVGELTALIGSISRGTVEQSAGLSQVAAAVQSLDDMTQQNATLVQASSMASAALTRHAGGLAAAVAVFRIHAPAPGGEPASDALPCPEHDRPSLRVAVPA